MDRRSWPWKKKSSDKAVSAASDLSELLPKLQEENNVTAEIVPIPEGLQPDELTKLLNEKLAAAQSQLVEKDNLVKQHIKVAEEAVSGWEQSECEAASLKKQLEEALRSKCAAEDRVSHLDSALKECVRQLRLVREEQEEKVHEIVSRKTREWDRARYDLEGQLKDVTNQLNQSANALSNTLQERNRTIAELNASKLQVEEESGYLRARLEGADKEFMALKYDFQVLQTEFELRNQENECNKKVIEAGNKQQLENVKKTARLEAECQRLRMLVRKKLPGPGALAEMRLEAESLGREPSDYRKKASKRSGCLDYAEESLQPEPRESELVRDRLRSMDEETTMLKEILAKKNSELQNARLMCAKTASRLSNVEEQLEQFRSGKQGGSTLEGGKMSSFDLMDDFAEMERLTSTDKLNESTCNDELEQTCDELRKKLASAEEQLKTLQEQEMKSGPMLKAQRKQSNKENLSDNDIDMESKARLRSAVCRIIHLVESLAQEYGSESSPEAEIQGVDGGVKRLVAVSKNLLQGKVPIVDFMDELPCVLDFVVGLGLSSGSVLGRSDSRKSSEDGQRSMEAEEIILQLRSEIVNLESRLEAAVETTESVRNMLSDAEKRMQALQEQLSGAREKTEAAEKQLSAAVELRDKLEARVEAADGESRQLRERLSNLHTELQEEQARRQDAEHKLTVQQPCSKEDVSRLQKEQELIAAAEKLAECQRTILSLGKQLESLGMPTSTCEAALVLAAPKQFSQCKEAAAAAAVAAGATHRVDQVQTYWSSARPAAELSNRLYLSECFEENLSIAAVPEIPSAYEVRTPVRYYSDRKSKMMSSACAELKSLNAADLSPVEKHGVLGRFFSRAKTNHG